ncbi:AMP-binding protein [Nocardioides sp. TF02-7]|uniref:AMP-binding protein n=1 Tax=Nocardioides sp. TF02-7 TaxID=2917724 RepID=UPI0023DA7B74|nr:AMP-binding protein [Nocardioides sp. TF02-7]
MVAVNVRLAEEEMRFILDHSGASLLVATEELADRARSLAAACGVPVVVAGGRDDDYEQLLAAPADPRDRAEVTDDQLLAINYTSGTTGRPKGVMYHHRGRLPPVRRDGAPRPARSRERLPVDAADVPLQRVVLHLGRDGGRRHHVCLRAVRPDAVWRLLRDEPVTHFSAAPTVLTMIAEDPAATPLTDRVHVDTGGAPPSPALLGRLERLGLDVTHLYGLTETFGPVAVNEWQPEWDELDGGATAALRARQGVGNIISAPLRVLGPDGDDVPADGRTLGEIAVRGNNVMLGYYRDPEATAAVTRSGCFLTGDLAVLHPRRLRRDPRPAQGHHHLRWGEHRLRRGGARPRRAPGRRGVRRRRQVRRPVGARCRSRTSPSGRVRRSRPTTSWRTSAAGWRVSRSRGGWSSPTCPRPPRERSGRTS